jgi:hypothetical protein
MPQFPEIDESHIPALLRSRNADIVYPLTDGTIFVVFSTGDIAIAQLLDKRPLRHVNHDMVRDACDYLRWPWSLTDAACENMLACKDHQHLWIGMTYEELAVACIVVTAMLGGKNTDGCLE